MVLIVLAKPAYVFAQLFRLFFVQLNFFGILCMFWSSFCGSEEALAYWNSRTRPEEVVVMEWN